MSEHRDGAKIYLAREFYTVGELGRTFTQVLEPVGQWKFGGLDTGVRQTQLFNPRCPFLAAGAWPGCLCRSSFPSACEWVTVCVLWGSWVTCCRFRAGP